MLLALQRVSLCLRFLLLLCFFFHYTRSQKLSPRHNLSIFFVWITKSGDWPVFQTDCRNGFQHSCLLFVWMHPFSPFLLYVLGHQNQSSQAIQRPEIKSSNPIFDPVFRKSERFLTQETVGGMCPIKTLRTNLRLKQMTCQQPWPQTEQINIVEHQQINTVLSISRIEDVMFFPNFHATVGRRGLIFFFSLQNQRPGSGWNMHWLHCTGYVWPSPEPECIHVASHLPSHRNVKG